MRTHAGILVGCACLGLGLAAMGPGCEGGLGHRASGGGIDLTAGEADDNGDGDADDDPDDPAGDDGDGDGDDGDGDDADDPPDSEPEPEVPFDPGMLAEVCARSNGDRVAQALCANPQIESIIDLREALQFEAPFFSLTANSSSLVARSVSAINPRLVIGDRFPFGDGFEGFGGNLLAMGFVRGEQFVELAGFDPSSDRINFYLLLFEQDCNDTEAGCSVADLVTPAVEDGWKRWTLYQDVDLVNTTVDCLVCHQPLGPDTPTVPRMQEVSNSWTHWFPVHPPEQNGGWSSGGNGTDGIPPQSSDHGTRSSELLWDQFQRMHSVDGIYGGVPLEELRGAAAGPDLETFVQSFLLTNPVPAPLQMPEEGTSDYFCDAADMELHGVGSSWSTEYQRVVAGQRLPLPSHRIDVSAEALRESAIDSYMGVVTGLIAPQNLQDPRAVIAPDTLTEMSILPRPDAPATEILQHMCSRCHNGNLDQTLTRARFDATNPSALDELTKAQIADRLVRDHDDRLLMPPSRFATLPDWAVERVLDWLEQ